MKFTSIVKTLTLAGVLTAMSTGAFAATILDFRGDAPPGTVVNPSPASGNIGSATFSWGSIQPAGSGTLDSFVRISQSNLNVVQGYNTNVDPIYQNTSDDTFNHPITVGQVGFIDQVNYQGGYMQFVLDINQNSANGPTPGSFLSLDELQVFVSTGPPNPSIAPVLADGDVMPFANAALVYQMDASDVGNQVLMDFDWFGGSGSSDLTVNLPRSLFETAFAALNVTDPVAQNGLNIYLYSRFGQTWPNNDGYEEWAYKVGAGTEICVPTPENGNCGQQQIPEPGMLPLVALGLLGAAAAAARRRRPS